MIKTALFIIMCFIILICASSCSYRKELVKKKISLQGKQNISSAIKPQNTIKEQAELPRITVWIHGTKGFGRISEFVHAMREKGLVHYSCISKGYRLGEMIKTLSQADPVRFPQEHCYAFGWSGELSFDARKKEARNLYNALNLLIDEYTIKYNTPPMLTLITHSHGGNVALNLANIKDSHSKLCIDQMILLACPVQDETKDLVTNPFFKRIYSFYSTSDMMQILDPQGLYKTEHNDQRHLAFSERQFDVNPKLRQTKLKINGHGVAHAGFIMCSFIKLLPSLIDETELWERELPSKENQERLLHITV